MLASGRFWQIFLIFYCLIAVYDLQAQTVDLPLPPRHLHGHQVVNKFVSQTDLVNIIKWKAPDGGPSPVAYHIYRNSQLTQLAAIIPADGKLRFKDHNRKRNRTYCYFIVSVDAAGNQSLPALITFKGSKVRSTNKPVLIAIEVTPINPQIPLGFTEQFRAIGMFSNGTTRDLTNKVTWTSSKSRVASISNKKGSKGLATSLRAGATTIKAALGCIAGSTTLTVTSARLVEIEVFPSDQTIPIGFTERFTAIGRFDDGTTENLTQQVTWSSSNPAVASISNDEGSQGIAIGLTPGSTVITATIQGISGSTILTVTPATLVYIEVFPLNPIIGVGHTRQFIAIGIFSDATKENLTEQVTWSSSNPAVASISNGVSKGLATGLTPGTSQIVATINGVSGSTTLTVTSAVLIQINVEPINPSLAAGFTQQFIAIGIFNNGMSTDLTEDVTWTSSNPSVATISNAPGDKGLATRLDQGKTLIKATLDGISGSTTLTVTPAVLVSLTVFPTNPSVAVGLKQAFTAIGTYSDGSTENLTEQVTWMSSNPTVASISNVEGNKGVATGKTVGSVTITATANGVSGSTTLTVTPSVLLSLSVTPGNVSKPVGFTQAFTATGTFSDGTTADLTEQVTWLSANPAIASVSNATGNEGVATALSVGSTFITATLNGVTDFAIFEVTPAILLSLSVTPGTASTPVGLTQAFTATGTFSDGTTANLTEDVSWQSANTAIAAITNTPGNKGIAKGLSVGSTFITATLNGVTNFAILEVTPPVLLSISVTPPNATVAVTSSSGTTIQYTATGTFSDGTTPDLTNAVTWASSNPNVATISSTGLALATQGSIGPIQISATFGTVTGSTSLTVTCEAPTIQTDDFLPLGSPGEPYVDSKGNPVQIQATGGVTPYTFIYIAETSPNILPPGLSLDPKTGIISGTISAATPDDIFFPLVIVQSACGTGAVRRFTIAVVN